jgi:hypothetical protein
LEAAIGIEPMNKGFAVIANLFAQDRDCIRMCIFIERVDWISFLLGATGADDICSSKR